jgi:hypothetical protein
MRLAGALKLIAPVFKPQLTLTRPDGTVQRAVGCKTKTPLLRGFEERMMGFEPTTFRMAKRRDTLIVELNSPPPMNAALHTALTLPGDQPSTKPDALKTASLWRGLISARRGRVIRRRRGMSSR